VSANTASDIDKALRNVLSRELPFFCSDDALTVGKTSHDVQLAYCSSRTSASPTDPTAMELRIQFDVRQMWIGDLRVSGPFRAAGLGRRLVRAAEQIARATGMAEVNVFPLASSPGFWSKMGYTPHRHTARVLTKSMDLDCQAQPSALRDYYSSR